MDELNRGRSLENLRTSGNVYVSIGAVCGIWGLSQKQRALEGEGGNAGGATL